MAVCGRLLTIGKRRAAKNDCILSIDDVLTWGEDSVLVVLDRPGAMQAAGRLAAVWPDDILVGLSPHYDGEDAARFSRCVAAAGEIGVSLIALGDVLMHRGRRKRLADVLSCIREKRTIDRLGRLALPNSERRLKSEFEMRRLFRDHPLGNQHYPPGDGTLQVLAR